MTNCPTCQGKLDSNNNMQQVQIMLIEHTCKFSIFGCDVEMKLDDINRHEEKCPNRSVTCPYVGCKKEVAMKKFAEHALENECAESTEDYGNECPGGDDYNWPYNLNESFDRDDEEQFQGTVFNIREDQKFKLPQVFIDGVAFYVFFHFLASKQSFVICVILPEDVETASKYNTRMCIGDDLDDHHRRRLTYEGPVISIEDLPDMNSSDAFSKYWIVPYDVAKPFFSFGGRLVQLPFSFSVGKFEYMRIRLNYRQLGAVAALLRDPHE